MVILFYLKGAAKIFYIWQNLGKQTLSSLCKRGFIFMYSAIRRSNAWYIFRSKNLVLCVFDYWPNKSWPIEPSLEEGIDDSAHFRSPLEDLPSETIKKTPHKLRYLNQWLNEVIYRDFYGSSVTKGDPSVCRIDICKSGETIHSAICNRFEKVIGRQASFLNHCQWGIRPYHLSNDSEARALGIIKAMTEKPSLDQWMLDKLQLHLPFITGKPNVLNCNDLWRYGFPNVLKNWFINVEGNSSFNLPENAEGHSFMSELSSRVLGENISDGYEPPEETF